ncbi:uncharacterized protein [Cherax quadricarinatus]|uniref:uncharacterized protein n=1 Tax=Cherax quadricarinatus TaxID=27406 RepID=UPI00387EDDE4
MRKLTRYSPPAIKTLDDRGFTISTSPYMLAKRSVFMKRFDKFITTMSTEDIKSSLEDLNTWAKIDSVVKIPNASSMLKITFLDVHMAARALSDGLAIYYFINPRQIEPERFNHITPCWTCYSYNHSTTDCHVKNKICSTCGSEGHDLRSCTTTSAPTCINCK